MNKIKPHVSILNCTIKINSLFIIKFLRQYYLWTVVFNIKSIQVSDRPGFAHSLLLSSNFLWEELDQLFVPYDATYILLNLNVTLNKMFKKFVTSCMNSSAFSTRAGRAQGSMFECWRKFCWDKLICGIRHVPQRPGNGFRQDRPHGHR